MEAKKKGVKGRSNPKHSYPAPPIFSLHSCFSSRLSFAFFLFISCYDSRKAPGTYIEDAVTCAILAPASLCFFLNTVTIGLERRWMAGIWDLGGLPLEWGNGGGDGILRRAAREGHTFLTNNTVTIPC